MKFDELFENRDLAAAKLKDYLRARGYTKISFSSWAGISRPTLDKLLSGKIENRKTFDRHMQKILGVLKITPDELIFFEPRKNAVDAVFCDNSPSDYQMSGKAEKEYGYLLDIIDLCEIYY